MVKKYLLIFTLFIFSLGASCQRHRVMKVGNETVLKKPNYRLDYILDKKGATLIDTTSVYVYTETDNSFGAVRTYLNFSSNGFVVEVIKFHEVPIKLKDFEVHANSVKRGKYELLNDNRIKLELFFPGEPVPFTNGWKRIIRKGVIVGDTIKIETDPWDVHNYVRQVNWR
ncbi:MAG: hypothetical protein ACJAUV_000867 [Flavobacteriales bacterium]|jgi:hypothetical protein